MANIQGAESTESIWWVAACSPNLSISLCPLCLCGECSNGILDELGQPLGFPLVPDSAARVGPAAFGPQDGQVVVDRRARLQPDSHLDAGHVPGGDHRRGC